MLYLYFYIIEAIKKKLLKLINAYNVFDTYL